MQKKQIHVFYKTLLVALTEKSFLRKAGLKKKTVLSLLQRERWLDGLEDILRGEVSCAAVLELCAEAMETLAGKTPQEGWLSYTYRFLIREIYPARKDISLEPLPRGAVFFYLAALCSWNRNANVCLFRERGILRLRRSKRLQKALIGRSMGVFWNVFAGSGYMN